MYFVTAIHSSDHKKMDLFTSIFTVVKNSS